MDGKGYGPNLANRTSSEWAMVRMNNFGQRLVSTLYDSRIICVNIQVFQQRNKYYLKQRLLSSYGSILKRTTIKFQRFTAKLLGTGEQYGTGRDASLTKGILIKVMLLIFCCIHFKKIMCIYLLRTRCIAVATCNSLHNNTVAPL